MNNTKRGAGILRGLKYALLILATVSLVKIAFFPGNDTPEHVSEGDFSQPTTTLEKNTIDNETNLSATILRDAPTPIRATASGQVSTLFVASGQAVNAGQGLFQVKSTTMPAGSGAAATGANSDSDAEAAAPAPVVKYQDIAAPSGGTVQLNVVLGQNVEAGQEIGTISPGSFHALAQLKPSQLYSMGDALRSGKLSITDGPGPFLCSEVKIVTASSAPATGSGEGSGAAAQNTGSTTGGGPQIRCSIPSDQTVYEGVPATLTIGGATTGEVSTLPVTAVEGRFNEGIVFLPGDGPGKKPVKRKVQLGANDGTNIEIKGGLKEGEKVLTFVPAVSEREGAKGSGDGGSGDGSDGGGDPAPADAPAAN